MPFGEKLKAFLNIEANLESLREIKLFGDRGSIGLFNLNNNNTVVNINVDSDLMSDPEKRKQLQEILRDNVLLNDKPLLLEEASKVVADLNVGDVYTPIFEFFKDKLPKQDVTILRAALYMRKAHDNNLPIDRLKNDIVTRYGQHGSNISNLCTAGYFESHFKPMYEEMSKREGFTSQVFIDSYNTIVDNAPFALFVSRPQTLDELTTLIIEKLNFNKAYGIKQLNIHAIGQDNIDKVKKLLEVDDVKKLFTSEPDIIIQSSVMNVALHYY